MTKATFQAFPGPRRGQTALKAGEIDYLFADGLGPALWMDGEDSGVVASFHGGPYLESPFFR